MMLMIIAHCTNVTYFLRGCGAVSNLGCTMNMMGTMFCVLHPSVDRPGTLYSYSLQGWHGAQTAGLSWTPVQGSLNLGVTQVFSQGIICPFDEATGTRAPVESEYTPSEIMINWYCNKDITEPTILTVIPVNACKYVVEVQSPGACV